MLKLRRASQFARSIATDSGCCLFHFLSCRACDFTRVAIYTFTCLSIYSVFQIQYRFVFKPLLFYSSFLVSEYCIFHPFRMHIINNLRRTMTTDLYLIDWFVRQCRLLFRSYTVNPRLPDLDILCHVPRSSLYPTIFMKSLYTKTLQTRCQNSLSSQITLVNLTD